MHFSKQKTASFLSQIEMFLLFSSINDKKLPFPGIYSHGRQNEIIHRSPHFFGTFNTKILCPELEAMEGWLFHEATSK